MYYHSLHNQKLAGSKKQVSWEETIREKNGEHISGIVHMILHEAELGQDSEKQIFQWSKCEGKQSTTSN